MRIEFYIVLNICFILGVQNVNAQVIYFNQADSIFQLNLNDCSTNPIFKSKRWTDIAISKDGTMYAIKGTELYKIDSTTSEIIHQFDQTFNNLTISYENVAYLVGGNNSLYSYNLNSMIEDSLFYVGYPSSGDLTFNNGDLWLSSNSDKFIKIDLTSENSSLQFDESLGGNPFAFTSSKENCEGNFGYAGFLQNNEGTTDVYKIDFDTNELTQLCTINKRFVYGFATKFEHLNSIKNFSSLRIEEIEIDTPSCQNNNGAISFELNGIYEFLNYSIEFNNDVVDKSVRTIENLSEGTYDLRITNALGCEVSSQISLECIVSTSTNNVSNENSKVYPNPFSDRIYIESDIDNIHANLFGIDGKIVDIEFNSTQKGLIIGDSSQIKAGLYFIKVGSQIHKLMKK